jgi:hypothetical protein
MNVSPATILLLGNRQVKWSLVVSDSSFILLRVIDSSVSERILSMAVGNCVPIILCITK